jgi:Zn finger protein HypA/HybF involved in hydrogenase expression
MTISESQFDTVRRAQAALEKLALGDLYATADAGELAFDLEIMIHDLHRHTAAELDQAAEGLVQCQECESRVQRLSEDGLCFVCASQELIANVNAAADANGRTHGAS